MIEDTVFLSVARRLAKRILLMARSDGRPEEGGVRITTFNSQSDLADRLGVSREIVNKTLKGFRDSGMLSYRNGYMVVHDHKQLEAIAG